MGEDAPALLINEVLPSRVAKRVSGLVLPVDQHIRIVAAQKRLSHSGRAEPQIKTAILDRQPAPRRLVNGPQQGRPDPCRLQGAPVDDDDLDPWNRLPAILPIAWVHR